MSDGTAEFIESGGEITEAEIAEFEGNIDSYVADVADLEVFAAEREYEVYTSLATATEDVEADGLAEIAGGYRVVDLRGRFCPARSSWSNSRKTYGVVAHYNGGPVPVRAWRYPLAWIKFINDLHAQPGRFQSGWQFNGIAYHEWILGNTVYRLRNYSADTPHCGNLAWNKNSLGLHIPIGGSQRPVHAGDGTLVTFQRRALDHVRAMGHRTRGGIRGHREVGSSLCPGEPIMAGVRYLRSA